MISKDETFNAFLSHSHDDSEWVEWLGEQLEDVHGLKCWLDKWVLSPGEKWQQEMAKGLAEVDCCIICVGDKKPDGWFLEEIELALDMQVENPDSYLVIPVLLPHADVRQIPPFLKSRNWVDFRDAHELEILVETLALGIKRQPVGRRRKSREVLREIHLKKMEHLAYITHVTQ
jgi:hypothetical protein